MKASQSVIQALSDLKKVEDGDDVKRVCSEMLLGLARKEVPACDVEAAAKMVSAQSQKKMVDLKTAQWAHLLRTEAARLTASGDK